MTATEERINVLVPLIPKDVIDRLDAFLVERDGEGARNRAAELREIIAEGVDRREKRGDHRASAEASQALRSLRSEALSVVDRLSEISTRLAKIVSDR